jgi:hypothetical protein
MRGKARTGTRAGWTTSARTVIPAPHPEIAPTSATPRTTLGTERSIARNVVIAIERSSRPTA